MSTNRAIEAAATKPATDQHTAAQPNWNVSNKEQLAQIRQERTPQAQAPHATMPRVETQPRQHEVRPNPTPVHTRPEAPPAAAQPGRQPEGRHFQPGSSTVTENNRTVNNTRNEYQSNNQTTNNNRYLYGGLAAGALVGAGGAALYQNREQGLNYNGSYGSTQTFNNPNYSNWNRNQSYNNYNNFNNYNNNDWANYNNSNYDQFGGQLGGQFGLNLGFDQIGSQLAINDGSQYLNSGAYGDQYGAYPSNVYGDTTYGSTSLGDDCPPPPPIEASYGPVMVEQRPPNPMNVIPQIFGSILGGVLGNITNSNHRRYWEPDC